MAKWVDPGKDHAAMVAAQAEYGQEIKAWLARSLPELEHHPAAVAAVIRLHYVHGRGSLTVGEHAPAIHAAVKDFDQRYGVV